MKKEADKKFGLDDSPVKVVHGKIIDAQSFEFVEPESGRTFTLLEFRLKPALDPDKVGAAPLDDEQDECFSSEHNITQSISLGSVDDVPAAIEFIDKAVLYLYATHGINYARLVRDGANLSFIETEQNTMDVENALAVASGVYSMHENLAEDEINADGIYESLLNFSVMVNCGDCVRSEDRSTLTFTELLDHSVSEFFNEDEDDAELEPDVTITLNPDYTMVLSHENEECNPVTQTYKISREGVLDIMEDLWKIGQARGYTSERELSIFNNLIALGQGRMTVQQSVQLMVPQKASSTISRQAYNDFMKADPTSHTLN